MTSNGDQLEERPFNRTGLLAFQEMNERHQRDAQKLIAAQAEDLGLSPAEWQFDPQGPKGPRFVRPMASSAPESKL